MREPNLYDQCGQNGRPFSQLTIRDLQEIAAGRIHAVDVPDDPDNDFDFAKRYAAHLLKERQ